MCTRVCVYVRLAFEHVVLAQVNLQLMFLKISSLTKACSHTCLRDLEVTLSAALFYPNSV